MARLLDFPPELIEHILSYTDLLCLLRCREVCKLLKQIVLNSTLLQYKIELSAEGLEDGPPGGRTTGERLQTLRKRRQAWSELRFTASQSVPMMGEFWALLGGVLAQASLDGRLEVLQLPSELRDVPEKRWVIEDLGVSSLLDIGMDPAEDLLILMDEREGQYILDLRSLRTGKSHPQARILLIPLNIIGMRAEHVELVTSSAHVAVFIHGHIVDIMVYRLFIYNWKTGSLELNLSAGRPFGFCFLDDQHMMFSHEPFPGGEVALDVFDLQMHVEQDPHKQLSLHTIHFECRFMYPVLSSGTSMIDTHIHTDPPPSWRPEAGSQVPFYKALGERALVITFTLQGRGVERWALIVPSSTILKHVYGSGQKDRRITWDEWGPGGTRLLSSPFGPIPWQNFVHGTSVIHENFTSMLPPASLRSLPIRLYDFGQLGAKKYLTDSAIGHTVPNLRHSFRSSFVPELVTSLHARLLEATIPLDQDLEDLAAVNLSEDAVILVYPTMRVQKYQILSF